jgi:hypothetical protein
VIGRIFALGRYLFRSLLLSLAGFLYILLALVFYIIFFDPRQRTPDLDYYILLLGLFGLGFCFVVTLTVAGRANQAIHYPLLVKLPSRIEYLSAVFLASIAYGLMMQFVLAVAALLVSGPELSIRHALEIPPIWIAGDILLVVVALHASDLVARGWSRVYVFSVLGLFLYLQSGLGFLGDWLFSLFNRAGSAMSEKGWESLARFFYNSATWLSSDGTGLVERVFGFVFWPFRAIIDGVVAGQFSLAQALAPAALLIYAALLYLLASSLFARKDLFLTE